MKLEALLQQHDERHKNKAAAAAREKEDTRFRRLRKDYMSDEDGHESLDSLISIGVDGAEEEWERGSSSSTSTRPPMSPPWRSSATGNGGDEEEETPSRRKRKAAQQAAAAASSTKEEAPKRRWEGGKKKAESMWDQFKDRYFSSHIPSNRYGARTTHARTPCALTVHTHETHTFAFTGRTRTAGDSISR
jgi:hypothetical protein